MRKEKKGHCIWFAREKRRERGPHVGSIYNSFFFLISFNFGGKKNGGANGSLPKFLLNQTSE
jgi:hypothetical protein